MNANPASLDYLIPVTVSTDTSVTELTSVEYPDGHRMTFQFSDQPLRIYDGTTRIPIRLRRTKKDASSVPIELRYQACNDQKCLPPDTLSRTVRFQ